MVVVEGEGGVEGKVMLRVRVIMMVEGEGGDGEGKR